MIKSQAATWEERWRSEMHFLRRQWERDGDSRSALATEKISSEVNGYLFNCIPSNQANHSVTSPPLSTHLGQISGSSHTFLSLVYCGWPACTFAEGGGKVRLQRSRAAAAGMRIPILVVREKVKTHVLGWWYGTINISGRLSLSLSPKWKISAHSLPQF